MDGRKILKHFSTIGIGTVLSMIIGFLSTMIITRMVDPAEYGRLSIFTLYGNIAETILVLGLDQALIRYYYKDVSLNYKHELLIKCALLPAIATLVAAFLFLVLTDFKLIQIELDALGSKLLCVFVFLLVLYRFSLLLLRLEYASKLYSLMNVIQKAVYLAVAYVLIRFFNLNDLYSLMIATVSGYALVVILSIYNKKAIWGGLSSERSENVPTCRELLNYSWPFILSMGITMFFSTIDKLSLQHFRDYTDVGVYTSTLNLVAIFSVLQITFTSLWGPLSVEHFEKAPEDVSLYQTGNRVITVLMFALGFLLIACKDVFAFILGEKYREAAYILPFLIFNPIMYSISETTVVGINFYKKSFLHVIIAAVSCMVNLCGNAFLVPVLGGKGAAISTGLSYIVFFCLRTVFSNRYYPVKYDLWKIFVLVGVAILYAAYNTFVRFNLLTIIGLIVSLLVIFILYKETVKLITTEGIRLAGSIIQKSAGGNTQKETKAK